MIRMFSKQDSGPGHPWRDHEFGKKTQVRRKKSKKIFFPQMTKNQQKITFGTIWSEKKIFFSKNFFKNLEIFRKILKKIFSQNFIKNRWDIVF
jgi:hypothetical protein